MRADARNELVKIVNNSKRKHFFFFFFFFEAN